MGPGPLGKKAVGKAVGKGSLETVEAEKRIIFRIDAWYHEIKGGSCLEYQVSCEFFGYLLQYTDYAVQHGYGYSLVHRTRDQPF